MLAVQDLNIDLQALALSLSSLPVWDVLDIDVALCKTHQPKTEHQSASINKENTLSPAEGNTVHAGAAAAAHSRSTMTMHMHSEHAPARDRSAESTSQVAASPKAKAIQKSPAPAAESVSEMQAQPVAPGLSQQTSAAQHSASLQTGRDALNSKSDSDDLDALLNTASSSTKPRTASTSISKPAQEQDSLEDWLNSL